jgi:hypothetical protein
MVTAPMSMQEWEALRRFVNGEPSLLGTVGVRDPENPCEAFDGRNYDGSGSCSSDGHYLCVECSQLSPEAPRFQEYGRQGRGDRLRLYWRRKTGISA